MTEQRFDKTDAGKEPAAVNNQGQDDQSLGAANNEGDSSQSGNLFAKIKSLFGGVLGGGTNEEEILIDTGDGDADQGDADQGDVMSAEPVDWAPPYGPTYDPDYDPIYGPNYDPTRDGTVTGIGAQGLDDGPTIS